MTDQALYTADDLEVLEAVPLQHARLYRDLIDAQPRPEGVDDDWLYRDVGWVREDWWKVLWEACGEDEHFVLAMSVQNVEDGSKHGQRFLRGQLFISPLGLANIKRFGESLKVDTEQPAE